MLVVSGIRHDVPGLKSTSFLEDPKLGLTSRNDFRMRRRDVWIRSIVLHTRMGVPVRLEEGTGPNLGWDEVLARRFSADERSASCHVVIDADGSYACIADLRRVAAYHASHLNELSIGIEMYQAADGRMWQSTIDSAVKVVDVITRLLGIQRQVPNETQICRRLASPVVGRTRSGKLAYMRGGAAGRDFCGVVGHRNITRNRGPGDPGDPVFVALRAAGYESYNIDEGDDLDVWSERQEVFCGIHEDQDLDGVPGPRTLSLLQFAGKPHGMWVSRPGDDLGGCTPSA